jgi:hypothetical protein
LVIGEANDFYATHHIAANATLALNAAEWFLLSRFIVSAPVKKHRLREQFCHLSPCPVFWGRLYVR